MPASASDWIRFNRLKASISYHTVVAGTEDTNNPQTLISSARDGFRPDQDRAGGLGKTRREASKWIDFKAAQQADFVSVSQIAAPYSSFARQLNRTQLCANGTQCVSTSPFQTGSGNLKSSVYQHSRIV